MRNFVFTLTDEYTEMLCETCNDKIFLILFTVTDLLVNVADINECESLPCQYGSTCLDGMSAYECKCVDGYIGINCEIGNWNI